MPDSLPLVSVVMPARNAESTIDFAMESILQQSYPHLELVLIDHDSSDRTLERMQAFAAAAPQGQICVAQCRGSFIEACNLAWLQARGTLIARMDADDLARPTKIARQVAFLKAHPNLAGCGTEVTIWKREQGGERSPPDAGYAQYENWINSVVTPEHIASQRFIDSPIPNPSIMLRRQVLVQYEGYRDGPWAEDYDLWLRMLHDGLRLGKVNERLLDWFDGESRATRTQDRYRLPRFQQAKAHFLAQLPMVQKLGVVISGAGPTGKRMARFLAAEGVAIHAFFEVNPRQIGSVASGKPILPVAEIAPWQDRAVMLAAVGQPGARERIRGLLQPTSFVEGHNFFCVA